MGKPDKMSEHDYQAQLRESRRKPKHGAHRKEELNVTLSFVLTPKAKRADAYSSLENSEVLREHARRYRYHEPRQLTAMGGRFLVTIPQSLVTKLKRELTPGWKIEEA